MNGMNSMNGMSGINGMMGIKEKLTVEFAGRTGYSFRDKELLFEALCHSSYSNEYNMKKNNERLEFLGDSVLSLIVAAHLFKKFPGIVEGDLSKIRASLVRDKSLAKNAKDIGLGEMLLLGKGEDNTGGRKRVSILEDAFEAVIGAIFLDGGIEPAREFVLRFVPENISKKPDMGFDYKTELQEIIQRNPDDKVSYTPVEESGPAHDKVFKMQVTLNNKAIGEGEGKSKKLAEQMAAKNALATIKNP
ncbi:MAG: ribonuclease III [Oscillospiraceae bacterium]|nr:ribonuclease III [Oscillospiraceae bacterium]